MEKSRGEETTLELPGLRLAAKVWGPADGLRVLALHGWRDNAASFDLLAPLLPAVRLVAIDLPGHGLSDHRPAGHSYHLVDYVQDVYSVLNLLGWQTTSLLGHSAGGGIACLVAGAFPERVERLALLEALAPLATPAQETPSRLADGIRHLEKVTKGNVTAYQDQAAMALRLQQACPGLSEKGAQVLVQRASQPGQGGWCWRNDPYLRAPSLLRLTSEQVYAFLDRIVCPTLILRASQGFPFDRDEERAQVRRLKDVRVVELQGGHHVHLDDPQRVAEALELFFASTRCPTTAPVA